MSVLDAFSLSGKVSVVTGANRGIGRALVNAAKLDSSVNVWTLEADDLRAFSVGRTAAQLAAALFGPGPNGEPAFLYPTSFAPLLADALTRNGVAIDPQPLRTVVIHSSHYVAPASTRCVVDGGPARVSRKRAQGAAEGVPRSRPRPHPRPTPRRAARAALRRPRRRVPAVER